MENIIEPNKEFDLPFEKTILGNYKLIPKKKGYSGITISNKRKNVNGYIYFIKSENSNFYKLGVSSNPKRRLADIDSYLPFNLEILSLHYFLNVYDVEEYFQEKYSNYKIRREWYNLTTDEASNIMIELHNLNVKQDAKKEKSIGDQS